MLDYRKHASPHLDKFKGIKLLVLDNDGILTSGSMGYFSDQYPISLNYNVLDGYNMFLIHKMNLKIAIISGRKNEALDYRTKVLKVDSQDVYTGVSNKADFLIKIMEKYNFKAEQVAFMGDDYIDISALKIAGLSISVPNRHPMVTKYCDYITCNIGGEGAVREVLDLMMLANDIEDEYTIELRKF